MFNDLREFIEEARNAGELKAVEGADWDLEIGTITHLAGDKGDSPVFLFDRIKGYPAGYRVVTNMFATPRRTALTLGLPVEARGLDLVRALRDRIKNIPLIPPEEVDHSPVKENILTGDDVDLYRFPTPKWHEHDGGRYIGTGSVGVIKDPDEGWINLGTYRLQLLDKNILGTQFIKGKHSDIMLKKYQAMKKPMPVAVVVGCDPLLFLMGAARFSAFESEYDMAGSIRGEPIEVVKCETNDLIVPATAEIVVEGEVDADKTLPEGPFGEYTGYYSGVGTDQRNFIKVNHVTFRNNPILMATTVGRAVTDTHMTMAISYGATLWQQLVDMKIPGIKAVYCPPEGSGRFLAIISLKQMYPGHTDQVLTAAISTEMGAYGLKTVIAVDEDIDPWDISRVMYALSFRFQPNRSQVIKRGRSTPLDPSLPIGQRDITGRLLLDATIPYDWKDKPIPIHLDPDMVKRVERRWKELGFKN